MPRSSGGRRGSSSSGSSSSDTIRRNVATSVALSSASERFERLTGDSRSCQVVFEMYEKCIMARSSQQYGASACDSYNDMVASCSRFKRDPHRRKWIQSHQEREERIQRKATAAGFATVYDYLEDQHAKDPALCRSRFKLYKECMSKSAKYGASSCNSYTDMVASCNGFKRDPNHSRVIQSHKEWAERTLRRANAAGFATLDEYIADNFEKDPVYCCARFKRYNKCIKENAGNKASCDYLRNNCKGFKRNAA